MAAVAAGVQAAGGLVGAMGAQQFGAAKAAALRFNAQVAQQNAEAALDQANRDAEAQNRQARQAIGAIEAAYGASGVTSDGSVGDVIAMSAANAELDRQNILYKGRLKAMGYEQEGALNLFGAKQAKIQANYESASAILSGGGKAAGTASQAGLFT